LLARIRGASNEERRDLDREHVVTLVVLVDFAKRIFSRTLFA